MNTSKMDKFQEKLQKVLVPIADKLSNQRHLALYVTQWEF